MAILNNITSNFLYELIILTFTGIISVFLLLIRRRIAEKILDAFEYLCSVKIYRQIGFPKKHIESDILIQDLLAEVRVITQCDRAYFLQFTNGKIYSSKNQMWKISLTNESLAKGIKSTGKNFHDILSSTVSEFLYPLWVDNLGSMSGIKRVSPENCDCPNKNRCQLPDGVVLYYPNDMDNSYIRELLLNSDVTHLMATPVINENNNQIGILCIDYCFSALKPIEIIQHASLLCKTSKKLFFQVKNKL